MRFLQDNLRLDIQNEVAHNLKFDAERRLLRDNSSYLGERYGNRTEVLTEF